MSDDEEMTRAEYMNIIATKQKPLFVKFTASWCGPCKSFAPIFDQFALENEDVLCCSVDCEKERPLAEKFSVMSIPTVVLVKDGQEIKQSRGKLTSDQLRELADS